LTLCDLCREKEAEYANGDTYFCLSAERKERRK
jgi:hypothetical protein